MGQDNLSQTVDKLDFDNAQLERVHVEQIHDDGVLSEATITWTPEEEKKLVRKIDLYLLPTIWLMYLLSYM